jgi:hypothetical protein
MFSNSVIAWREEARKNVIALVKFRPFETMDKNTKSQYQKVAHHLIQQTKFQNPNKVNGPALSGKMFSLGWRKGFEKDSIIGITGISEKVSQDPEGYEDLQAQVDDISRFVGKQFQALSRPLYEEVKSQHNELHAPGLTPLFESDPDTFTCHLSYTFDNFANKPHTDRDSSPYSFVTWLPINQRTGDLIEEELDGYGGEFVFPRHGFGINFSGFKGVVECAWKATHHFHHTLPSSTPNSSLHT